MPGGLPSLDDHQLKRLDPYLATYRDLFARADQAKSFGLYVRGLLDGDHRKNVESIAEALRALEPPDSDLAQSLQHFVSQSPWDAAQVVARYRTQLVPAEKSADLMWVIHDGIIAKKGRHSVGVQRQFARSLGRKANCQVAVVISEVNGACLPLTLQLYLPAFWLRENAVRLERSVPEPHRLPVSKPELALAALDELLPSRASAQIVAEEGYAASSTFRDGLESRGLSLAEDLDSTALSLARQRFDWLKEALGLSHFEGRTWIGWHHHAALVLVAYGFLLHDAVPFPVE
jgi:SRSO17 transposase